MTHTHNLHTHLNNIVWLNLVSSTRSLCSIPSASNQQSKFTSRCSCGIRDGGSRPYVEIITCAGIGIERITGSAIGSGTSGNDSSTRSSSSSTAGAGAGGGSGGNTGLSDRRGRGRRDLNITTSSAVGVRERDRAPPRTRHTCHAIKSPSRHHTSSSRHAIKSPYH